MKTVRRLACVLLLGLLAVQVWAFPTGKALAETTADTALLLPEAGDRTRTDGKLTVDYSHMDRGYVMVKARKCGREMRLMVTHGADSLYYRVNGEGRYEIIPLQFGSGRYQFTLGIARTKGSNRYAASGSVCLKCSMKDETSCFLYPNQYVDYSADSPAVKKARDLCEGLSDPGEIADRICDYVGRNYIYDWSRAGAVRSGRLKDQLPDVNTAWTTGKGTCQDLSALTCVMLRSRGIPAKLAIGRADGGCHCWVVIIIDGKSRRFDPTAAARSYQAERYY